MIGNENFDLFVYLTGGLAVLLGSFAAAAGIGGGGIYVPLFILVASLSPQQAVPRSACATLGLGLFNFLANAASGDTINITAGSYIEPMSSIPFTLTFVTTGGEVTIATTSTFIFFTWLLIDPTGVVTFDGQFTLSGAALYIAGSFYQYGTLTATPTLYIYNGIVYQHGSVSVTCPPATYVAMIFDGVWKQYGDLAVTAAPTFSGIIFANPLGPTWYQYGNVKMTVTGATGVNLVNANPGYWIQYGDADIVVYSGGTGMCSRVHINMRLTLHTTGVYIPANTQWFQNGTISFTLSNSTGVHFAGAGEWLQEGDAVFNISGSTDCVGVAFEAPGATWLQNASLTISASGTGIDCVLFDTLGAVWKQLATTSISVHGSNSCGVNFTQGQPAQWQQLGSEPNFVVSGSASHDICPTLPNPLDVPIQFNFNATNPAVILSQTGAHVLNGSIEYAFDSLQELSSNNTIVQQISLQNVTWSLDSHSSHNVSGVAREAVNYTSFLPNGAALQYMFLATPTQTMITLANNYTFAVDPQYLKFSIWLSFWNWTTAGNRLRFTVRVSPAFNDSEQGLNTPIANMTTVFMQIAGSNATGALVELLDFGLAGPQSMVVDCLIETNAADSTFSVTFSYFGNLSLYYDPGLSLVLGQSGSSFGDADGSGSDNTSLVIPLAVSIPVAFCFVLMVILGAFAFIIINYIRSKLRQGGMVNFTTGDLLRRNADRRDDVATL